MLKVADVALAHHCCLCIYVVMNIPSRQINVKFFGIVWNRCFKLAMLQSYGKLLLVLEGAAPAYVCMHCLGSVGQKCNSSWFAHAENDC